MCLITRKKGILTAKDDIVVKKYGGFIHLYKFISSIRFHVYECNILHTCESLVQTSMKFSNYEDFEGKCFDRRVRIHILDRCNNDCDENDNKTLYITSFGFHSIDINREDEISTKSIGLAIIPKDSEYIKDETGLYVSNSIKILSPDAYPQQYTHFKFYPKIHYIF